MTTRTLQLPIGTLHATATGGRLVALRFGPAPDMGDEDVAVLDDLRDQLAEFFAGSRTRFDLPLTLGGTPFQRRVWAELQKIDFGEAITYGELARRVGNERASRAVGTANGKNPLPILIPCHRVVAAGGQIGGYSGGGATVKRFLLDHERAVQTSISTSKK